MCVCVREYGKRKRDLFGAVALELPRRRDAQLEHLVDQIAFFSTMIVLARAGIRRIVVQIKAIEKGDFLLL